MHREDDIERLLLGTYIKVLRVNLTEETYEELKVNDAERNEEQGYQPTITAWLDGFAQAGNVLEEDRGRYEVLTDLDVLRRRFALGEDSASVLYRRRNDRNEYRWVRMTISKSYDYAPDNEIVMLYVEDVNDVIDLSQEIAEQRQITRALTHMYFTTLYVDNDAGTYRRVHVARELASEVPEHGTIQEAIDLYMNRLVIPEDPEQFLQNFAPEQIDERLRTRRSCDYEYWATTPGGRIWCRIAAVRVDRHGDGRPRHMVLALQDLTAQVEASLQETGERE